MRIEPEEKTHHWNFGRIIRIRLIELNMTQVELAKRVGMGDRHLNAVLRGRRSGRKYRKQICEELGLDMEEVLKKSVS